MLVSFLIAAIALVAACSFPGTGQETDAPVAVDGDRAPDALVIDAGPPDAPPFDADLDTDNDGIDDVTDNCVQIPNLPQHDHDTDGRGDECDLCPHLDEAMDVDGDLDGVGDACDPRDGLDMRVMWFGFYDAAEIAAWGGDTAEFSISGGSLVRTVAMAIGSLAAPGSVHNAHATTAIIVGTASPGAGSRSAGVAVGSDGLGTQSYACYGGYSMGSKFTGSFSGYRGKWPPANQIDEYSGLGGATFGPGLELTVTTGITAAGAACDVNAIPTTGAIGPSRDGAVALFSDDTTASYDYLFVVAVGD